MMRRSTLSARATEVIPLYVVTVTLCHILRSHSTLMVGYYCCCGTSPESQMASHDAVEVAEDVRPINPHWRNSVSCLLGPVALPLAVAPSACSVSFRVGGYPNNMACGSDAMPVMVRPRVEDTCLEQQTKVTFLLDLIRAPQK